MMPPRRKKWTEAEEKTLIEKYGEMVSDGTLAKMKTREKKYKPIALYVNYVHHVRDPISYPWQWTWKDVSTKVQNMRHQYLLVKQKIKKPELSNGIENSIAVENMDDFDWVEGVTHWSNFLLYKEVFGDVPMAYSSNGVDLMGILNEDRENGGGLLGSSNDFGQMGNSADGDGDFAVIDVSLGFDYEGEEAEENNNGNDIPREGEDDGDVSVKKKKRRKVMKKKMLGFFSNRMRQLREIEARFEQNELEREREKHRMEKTRKERDIEFEQKFEEREKEREEREKTREKLRWQKFQEWEAMKKETEERERRRREESAIQEREWEARINIRRSEWKKRIDTMLGQHREEMGQIQNRIIHEQQNLTSQLLGITSLSDHTSSHYISQMMQNLQHVNGMVHEDATVDGDTPDDQFIVDG